jgi:transposase InsO family protein
MTYERYAIYWSPRPGTPLAGFARNWLGGDPETGVAWGTRELYGLDTDLVERATVSPRRYGCHATIKAPFRLREGANAADLSAALADLCARRRPARGGRLHLHRLSHYLALTLADARAEIEWLADECVTHFDRFRAPLSEADRARRPRHLAPLAREHLEQFGYSDIFSRFLFHITLAGPLEAAELARVEAAIAPAVEPYTREPFAIEDLCVCGGPGQGGLFKVLSRHALMR